MKRFRNIILVAGLGDGPVPRYLFARALTLSKRNTAKLTLIDVVPRLGLIPEVLPHEVLELTLSHRRESLLRLAESAREQGNRGGDSTRSRNALPRDHSPGPAVQARSRDHRWGSGRGCMEGGGQYDHAPDAQVPLCDLGCSADQ